MDPGRDDDELRQFAGEVHEVVSEALARSRQAMIAGDAAHDQAAACLRTVRSWGRCVRCRGFTEDGACTCEERCVWRWCTGPAADVLVVPDDLS